MTTSTLLWICLIASVLSLTVYFKIRGMSKIGRNDLCPCGSGKKYKNCYLKHQCDGGKHVNTEGDDHQNSFDSLIQNYNSGQILGLLGALQLNPINHGRNYRFEQLCLTTLQHFTPNDNKPLATWEVLKETIENYTDGAMMEDPLSNSFTEIAIFEEGNYIVFPGMYDGFTDILNQLTECIFLQKNTLDHDFIKNVRDAVGLLLFMSNSIGREANHEPYIFLENDTSRIIFPEYDKAILYTEAIYFTNTFLKELAEAARFDIDILNDFIIQPGANELREDNEDPIVNFKPLAAVEGAIVVYMPTAIPNALVSYIYQKAREFNCYTELMDLVYERQFHLSCLSLAKTGWLATDISLPVSEKDIPVIETVFQFDNDKLAYICYLKTGEQNKADEYPTRDSFDKYEIRVKQVTDYLGNITPEQPHKIFCFYIIGETANNFFFSWSIPKTDHQSLALKYRDLWTIINTPKVNSLTLWKFAKCYGRTSQMVRIMAPGGTMDAYAVFRKNHGSILDSDEARPMGGMLMIMPGSSDDLKREIQKNQNEHVVPVFYNGRRANAKVRRFKNYAPIYIQTEANDYFRIVIESYKMPIWITNSQTKPNKESWGTYVCEAVAFWLNKMVPFLAKDLTELSLIQFEIDVTVDDRLLHAEQFELREIEASAIQLEFNIVPPVIHINMPFEYIYAVMLADNTADKILMRSILAGISQYIRDSGSSSTLDSKRIEEIIEIVLQPISAKMLLFSDASVNIKMDARDLLPMRYLNETDISYILDNLVSYLPKDYKISKNIVDKKEKIKLCDDIVAAIIDQITVRAVLFEGPGLLKWLIRLNERCIQLREFREILIPAKIACFSNFEDEIDSLMDDEQNLVTTAHAIRTLVEFIASKVPGGTKWPNYDDIDELMALTNQLTNWGAVSEAMRMDIDNPQMGLLDSGRIGISKTMELEALKPYAVAKTESTLFRNIEDFGSNYVAVRKDGIAEETKETKSLDAAFKAEFGITLTTLSKITGTLINEGFSKATSCIEMTESGLKDLLLQIKDVSENEVNTAIELMTLLERKSINLPPVGYSSADIFPWRYNRSISYMRRPLVKFVRDGETYFLFGYRHVMQYMDNILYLLYSSKLPEVKTKEMRSWLASISGEKGNPLRNAAKKWFEENSDYEVVPHEVKMNIDASKGHIKTEKHYGDIDLLVIDHKNRIIYPIECKNIHGGRNVHEMKVEMDEYLGRDGNDKKAKMRKHVDRDLWLRQHAESLESLVPNAKDYLIKSFILTADEIPLAYLKKGKLPLPLKSFSFLRKRGLSYLSDL